MEIEKDNKINFLDLTISKNDNKHRFKIYRKETYCDIIQNKNSKIYNRYKFAAFDNLIHRAMTVPMEANDFNEEIETIKQIAVNNNFNSKIIDNMIKNKKHKLLIKNNCKLDTLNSENKRWVSIPYKGLISEKIGTILEKSELRVGYKSDKNLGQILCKVKDDIDLLDKSGVYKLTCDDCNGVYIGQTGRKLKDRIKEHNNLWKNKKTGISNFADHLIEKDHRFSLDNIKILHINNKGRKLDLQEQLQIFKHYRDDNYKCLNDITYLDNLSILLNGLCNK